MITDEYILNKGAELVADKYMENIWKLEITQDIYVLIRQSNTAEIRTEQNWENKNEQFKILKNKVKFESYILIHDRNYCFQHFFSMWVFFHEHSRITGLQGKGEGISLFPHYHFHPLHRRLDISQTITGESSPLHIASSRIRTREFLVAERK